MYGFFIIGLPGETEKSFKNTIDFARRCDFDIANFTMALPFVGTELHRMVESHGTFLLDTTHNIDHGFYGGTPFYTYGDTPAQEYFRRYKLAYKMFYTWRKRLRMIVRIRSFSELMWYTNAALDVFKGFGGKTRSM